LNKWADFKAFHAPFAGLFARSEPRQQAAKYLRGLMAPVERKNGWQIAEAVGDQTPDPTQRLLYGAQWDADEARDQEVFLAYATPKGQALLDRRLYLSQEWCADAERRAEAKVPQEVEFQTKPEQAIEMLEPAWKQGVPMRWVTGDEVYGDSTQLRDVIKGEEGHYICVGRFLQHAYLAGKASRGATNAGYRRPASHPTPPGRSCPTPHYCGCGGRWVARKPMVSVDWG